jgi:hypothetical protein
MYLSKVFLEWPYGDCESTGVDYELLIRAHDIWRHAQDRLKKEPCEFDLVDCISALKRSVNSRLKTLDKVYNLSALPSLRSKKQVLEKYQDYGLIRPAILKDLFDVRNLLEHEDVKPPSAANCHYYVDIVWYFLKSTDSLLQMKCDSLVYGNDRSEIFVGPDENWNFSFNGQLEKSLLSEEDKEQFVEISDVNIREYENNADMVRVSGAFIMDDDLRLRMAREYFGAVNYWYEDHA